MHTCVFCEIVKGKIPAHKVYEDNDFIAFLDIHPQAPGHVQVIPKAHHRWVWDVPNAGAYFEVVKKIACAQQKVFQTDAVWSRIMGDEVHHAHIWVFPNPNLAVGDRKAFEGNAAMLQEELAKQK